MESHCIAESFCGKSPTWLRPSAARVRKRAVCGFSNRMGPGVYRPPEFIVRVPKGLASVGVRLEPATVVEKGIAQAEAKYPGWLCRLLTHRVRGLENYRELFEKLTSAKGAIKVFCEVNGADGGE